MDRQTATQLIGNTFNFPFDEGKFRNFAINLFAVDESKGFILSKIILSNTGGSEPTPILTGKKLMS